MEAAPIEISKKLSLLVRLAVSDRHFAGLEREFILRVGRKKNLSDTAIEHLIRFPLPSRSPLSASQEEKVTFLQDCLGLVRADLKVLESEVIFFRSIAQRLGFRKEIVDHMLENESRTGANPVEISLFLS